ncbi:hypothetical protein [Sorangium sp. So ce131]|uniref:hypothetical protein n=1 Tax=Sorangium sp. So ce131 TaxID=3133282 RepID=UPI003F5E5BF9
MSCRVRRTGARSLRTGGCLRRTWARAAACALALALAVVPRVSFAQAETLLDEGKKLMKKGNLAEACPKLEESYRLSPRSATLLQVASCHEKQGKLATAWSEYIDLGAAARKEGNKRLEADAKARGARIELRVPRLTLNVPRAAAVEGLEVMLDGAPVDRSAWGQARPVDPGQHKVSASAPGRKAWELTVTIKRGERKSVAVPVLAKDPSAAPGPEKVAEAPAAAPPAAPAKDPAAPAAAAPGKAGAGAGKAEAATGKAGAAPGKAEAGKAGAAPGKAGAGAGKAEAATGKAGAGTAKTAAAPEEDAPPAAEEPEAAPDASPRHSNRYVLDVGVSGGLLVGLVDAGTLGNLSSYSYSYNVPGGGELIAPCNEDVCHAGFEPAIGPFAGGHVFFGLALSEEVHLGVRALGGYRFGGGYLVAGGPSGSMRFGPLWVGLSGLVAAVAQNAKVTGIKGEIPSDLVDINYGRSEVDVTAREGSLPETALLQTLAFGGSVDLSLVIADWPSSSWTSGALLLNASPTFMKGLDGFVIAAPVSLGYRFH